MQIHVNNVIYTTLKMMSVDVGGCRGSCGSFMDMWIYHTTGESISEINNDAVRRASVVDVWLDISGKTNVE